MSRWVTISQIIFASSHLRTSSLHAHSFSHLHIIHLHMLTFSLTLSLSLSLSPSLTSPHTSYPSPPLSFDESHTYTCDYPPVRSRAIPRFILVCKKVILPYIPDLRSFLGTGDIRQTFWIGPPKPTVQIAAKLDPELSAGSLDTVDGNQICTD